MPADFTVKRTCSVWDCEAPHAARGWCRKHYERWRVSRDASIVAKPGYTARNRKCEIGGCGKAHKARGYCKYHYQKWFHHGDPLAGRADACQHIATCLVDASFGNWLAGFIDGEGCFYIAGTSARHTCAFRLGLRLDDVSILHEIVEETLIGRVSTFANRRTALWSVTSKTGCLDLIALLDSHPLRAKKRNDFLIWRRAVDIWVTGGAKRGATSELTGLKTDLCVGRRYPETVLHA